MTVDKQPSLLLLHCFHEGNDAKKEAADHFLLAVVQKQARVLESASAVVVKLVGENVARTVENMCDPMLPQRVPIRRHNCAPDKEKR